jgi:hypothetical protein
MWASVMSPGLETLVNPLGRLAGGEHNQRNQQQAQQQRVQVFTREDSSDEFHG